MNLLYERAVADDRVAEMTLMRRIRRFPFFNRVESPPGRHIIVEGEDLINFGSNNYLGLSTDGRVIEAATDATRIWGTGVTGSRLLNGTLQLHEQLESSLASFYNKAAALVFPTGYTANLGLLGALLRPEDRVAVDRDVHASILDALLLSGTVANRFTHNRPDAAKRKLKGNTERGSALIIEGVYSMKGDAAPVSEMATVAEESRAMLIVDEAHGLGTVGARGRGAAELDGALDRVDVLTVTFSKSLASCGGAVIGPAAIIDLIKVRSRPFLFTASNTPGSIAAALCALQILRDEPEMVSQLKTRVAQLRGALLARDISVAPSDSAIVTVATGSDLQTLQAWRMLRNRGVFCNPVLTPAVPRGCGLLRLSVMRTHSIEDIERTAVAFEAIKRWTGEVNTESYSLEMPVYAKATND